jgi:hypothetical protein
MTAEDAEILLLSREQLEAIEAGEIAALEARDQTWFVGREEQEDAVEEAVEEADVEVNVDHVDVDRKIL